MVRRVLHEDGCRTGALYFSRGLNAHNALSSGEFTHLNDLSAEIGELVLHYPSTYVTSIMCCILGRKAKRLYAITRELVHRLRGTTLRDKI